MEGYTDMDMGRDTFARYCLDMNGDCSMGHGWCTCLEHGGCGWWADRDNKTRIVRYGEVMPCERFNEKCRSYGYK